MEFRKLKELRSLLRRIFEAVVAGAPNRKDLERLSSDWNKTSASTKLTLGARRRGSDLPRVKREITAEDAGESLLRFRIVEAAGGLLVSEEMLPRLKSCPACGWFFLDASKNRSRRWCSMRTCGSVAKARSYYRRTKTSASEARH
jgi:predicted RNA-binding Zn ribbon-like protein